MEGVVCGTVLVQRDVEFQSNVEMGTVTVGELSSGKAPPPLLPYRLPAEGARILYPLSVVILRASVPERAPRGWEFGRRRSAKRNPFERPAGCSTSQISIHGNAADSVPYLVFSWLSPTKPE